MQRTVRPILPVLVVVLVLGACTSGSVASSASAPASEVASSDGCPTAPALTTTPDGWPQPGNVIAASVLPLLVSTDVACGRNRLLFTFIDPTTNQPLAKPERTATISLYDLDRDATTPVVSVEGTFIWGIVGERGVYAVTADLARAGTWGASITTSLSGGAPETVRLYFDVAPTRSAKGIGDPAPSVATPTLADAGGDVRRVSSDPDPRPAFYETSVDAALTAHRPFVLVFATPAFCTSAQCGPTLEIVKAVADAEPDLLVINVEPYQLRWDGRRLQADLGSDGALQATPAVDAYGILTEPWIYVVDRNGIIRASLEGFVGAEELQAAIAEVR